MAFGISEIDGQARGGIGREKAGKRRVSGRLRKRKCPA